MKRKIILILVFLTVASFLFAQRYRDLGDLLATSVNVGTSTTVTNAAADFVSKELPVKEPDYGSTAFFIVTFTRSAGSTSTVDFEFEASHDGGTTWTTDAYVKLEVPTETIASTNVVRDGYLVNVSGISHIRLSRIVNNDASNALTACNVSISIRIER